MPSLAAPTDRSIPTPRPWARPCADARSDASVSRPEAVSLLGARTMTTAPPEALAVVETALRMLDLVPDEVLVSKPDALPSWSMKRGSAKVVVGLVAREALGTEGVHLRLVAPIVVFAEDTREALFLRLLQLNAAGLSWCAFGILGDSVVVVAERPTENLEPEEVVQTIRQVAAVADTFDDRLVAEFGGKRSCDF